MAIETPIRISTNVDELQDESEFLGEIVADEITPGQWGAQLHLAVRPLNFAIAGKTGWFHEWYKISRAKRSKLGALIVKCADLWGKDLLLGQGTLVGKRAWFIRSDIVFGQDRETGEELKAEQVLIPTRLMQPGDEALILVPPPAGTGSAPVTGPTGTDFSDDDLALLLSAIDGAQVDRLAVVGARTNLPSPLKLAVMSGTALKTLVDLGLVEVTPDNTVRALIAVESPAPEVVPTGKAKAPRFAKS